MWYISRFSGSIPGGLALVALCGVLTAAGFADDRPTVYTTFYPTTYFAQRIGGDVAQVVCPCPADADPAYWMPKDEAIAAYQKADLIVINGASFEKWLPKVTLPESRIVDTARPLRDTLIKLEQAVTHSHGPEGEHVHHGIDGHTWVDPMNAKTQAREILKALVRKLPAQKVAFERNFAALAKDLDVLDARLRTISKAMADQQLVSNHPTYNYLARRYGWNMEVFYLEPDGTTAANELVRLHEFLKAHPVRYLMWESEPDAAVAQKMQDEFGLTSIVYEPAETLDPSRQKAGVDFLTIMNANLDRLAKTFDGQQ